MKSRGKNMFGIKIGINELLMILAMGIFIYTMFQASRRDETAEEKNLKSTNDILSIANGANAKAEKAVQVVEGFQSILNKDSDERLIIDRDITSRLQGIETRVDAIEKRPTSTPPPLPAQLKPIKVEPIKVEVEVIHTKPTVQKAEPKKKSKGK